MHLGHQHLVEKTVAVAKELNSKTVVITFSPNPYIIINELPQSSYHIISKEDKHRILKDLDVDYLVDINFTSQIASLKAENFLQTYIAPLRPKAIIIGHDHHFGKNRKGNYNFLLNNSERYKYQLISVTPFTINNEVVSSSI